MYGTHSINDSSLVVQFGQANVGMSVAAFGEEKAYAEVARVLEIHNKLVGAMRADLCQETTEYQSVYGGAPTLTMKKGNEFSNPLVQKVSTGLTIGFPLDKHEIALQWTRRGFELMSLAKFKNIINAVRNADLRDFRTTLQDAIFTPTNKTDYVDYMLEGRTFPVFAFLNGDGRPIPAALDGSPFAANHSHYTFATSLTEQVVRDTITNVAEHGVTGSLKLFIPKAFESAIVAMKATGAFNPYIQNGIHQSADTSYDTRGVLDMVNVYNRPIGSFDAAEVVVKSWVPANYLVCVDTGQPDDKPLALRIRPDGLNADLGIRYENETYPLRASVMDREYGIAPWHRHKVAVAFVQSGATAYVAPTVYPA